MKCCDLTAGKLRHRVTIKKPVTVVDGGGGRAVTWTTVIEDLRALLKPASASEQYFAGKQDHRITHKLWLRYRSDVDNSFIVVYNDREMQVRGVINVEERDRWLELSLEEGVSL